jgi:hypothetical protein
MKKQILLIAAIAASTFAMSQSTRFGIRGGVTSSSMKGEAVDNLQDLLDFTNGAVSTASRTGFFAGVHASLPLSDVISVEPALLYSQKGYEMKGELNLKGVEFLGINGKARLTSHYVDLPVLMKANIGGLQVFAGPQVSYLTKADLRTTAGLLGFNLIDKTMDATDEFNRWDAAVTGGIGYKFANGFNVTASYDHGLSKVDANQNVDSYNRSFKVGVGFNF